ncbi:endoribonuclease VapD [Bacteroidia bacterium]|nr:endoribonuclease VapD [Bacteroidia bacterium]
MFAIAFDMSIADLKKNYGGESYNNAYFDIRIKLREFGFYNTQGSVYLTENRDMSNLFKAIAALRSTEWFRLSVRDIRAFRVEDWSDFTDYVKN